MFFPLFFIGTFPYFSSGPENQDAGLRGLQESIILLFFIKKLKTVIVIAGIDIDVSGNQFS